jgi:hypothetical protein
VDTSADADAVEWSCCRCVVVGIALYVNIEVADHDLAVVEVVVVNDVVSSWMMKPHKERGTKMRYRVYDGAAVLDDRPCGCQRVSSAMSPSILPGREETH